LETFSSANSSSSSCDLAGQPPYPLLCCSRSPPVLCLCPMCISVKTNNSVSSLPHTHTQIRKHKHKTSTSTS
jgi:hypothetical protein